MTAKEKANELIKKFVFANIAIICVNEILEAIDWHEFETPNQEIGFWLDVRKELNEL